MTDPEEWIAALGLRAVSEDPSDTTIPDAVLNDPALSLTAKGLYALAISGQGKPLNPFDDALESTEDIDAAIDELMAAGLIMRVRKP